MKHLELFENFGREREMVFTSKQNRKIVIKIHGGRIKEIDNQSGIQFPYSIGQAMSRNIETWACNKGFKIDGKDPCPEEKVFGIRKKDIPKGHAIRQMYPGKFRD